VSSVEKWNEHCATGADSEFGVSQRFLQTIDTPPYWGINQYVKIIAVNSGITVDGNYQVVDADLNPIPSLFAAGTVGGDVCGNNDWRMSFGFSNGHCMTAGRYSVLKAIHDVPEPMAPVPWDEVRSLYGK
jgi:hypothetical protein